MKKLLLMIGLVSTSLLGGDLTEAYNERCMVELRSTALKIDGDKNLTLIFRGYTNLVAANQSVAPDKAATAIFQAIFNMCVREKITKQELDASK